jgi:hypothetical protein
MSSALSVPCLNQTLTTYHLKDTEEECKITIANKQTTKSVLGSSENSMLVVEQAQLSEAMPATSKEASLTRITAITIQTSSELHFSV